jgi:1,4-alpha-glucan branching enzyme
MDVQFGADAALLPHAAPGGVRFTFDAAPGTRSVALAGTFNSWVGDACMLDRVSSTRWQTVLPVPAGRHLYKLVVDGTHWIADPANPWISEDGQHNSCLTVDATDAVLMRHAGLGAAAPGPLHARAARVSPDWLRDGVIYQLSVPAFGGDFDGVRAKLPYLDNLGADVLWIMPIHPVGIARRRGALGDPYAVRDFDAIDRRLGDAAALRALVDAAHARGMRVLMDWTLNRSSIDHPFTRTHPHWYTRRPDGSVYYAVPDRGEFAGFDFADRALRRALIDSMRGWIERFGFDGLRFDDADITPCNFLDEIRAALGPGVALISQSYDEFHHLDACDLTYEGGTRALLDRIDLQLPARRAAHALAGRQGAGPRVGFPGPAAHRPAAAVLLAMDGVPHILMGQEFDEPTWTGWTVLFNGWRLDWTAFDATLHAHYRTLIACAAATRRCAPARRRSWTACRPAPAAMTFDVGLARCRPLYASGWRAEDATLAPHGWMIGLGPPEKKGRHEGALK